jgi:hypothetical protein
LVCLCCLPVRLDVSLLWRCDDRGLTRCGATLLPLSLFNPSVESGV